MRPIKHNSPHGACTSRRNVFTWASLLLVCLMFALLSYESKYRAKRTNAINAIVKTTTNVDRTPPLNLEIVSEYEGSEAEEEEEEVQETAYKGVESIKSEVMNIRGAPRTYAGRYNEIRKEEKYVLYQPSGGFSNQRIIMAQSMEIARQLNRTLLVPMIGHHSSMWKIFWQQSTPGQFPADRLLDFPWMEEMGLKVVPLNMSLRELLLSPQFSTKWNVPLRANGKVDFFSGGNEDWKIWFDANANAKIRRVPQLSKVWKTWKGIDSKFIFLAGASCWQRIVDDNMFKDEGWRYTRFAPYFRGFAMRLSQTINGGDYNAMHVRVGDYVKRFIRERGQNKLLKKTEEAGFDASSAVYLATEPTTEERLLSKITAKYSVQLSQDLDEILMEEFDELFPAGGDERLRNDILGNVEQLVCAMAKHFVGTSWSTFSAWIYAMRTARKRTVLMPETV